MCIRDRPSVCPTNSRASGMLRCSEPPYLSRMRCFCSWWCKRKRDVDGFRRVDFTDSYVNKWCTSRKQTIHIIQTSDTYHMNNDSHHNKQTIHSMQANDTHHVNKRYISYFESTNKWCITVTNHITWINDTRYMIPGAYHTIIPTQEKTKNEQMTTYHTNKNTNTTQEKSKVFVQNALLLLLVTPADARHTRVHQAWWFNIL